MNENQQEAVSPGVEVKPLTDWKNPPTLLALKQDLQDAKPIHDEQRAKIGRWLDNLNMTGTAKIKPAKGRSGIQPKLIRKQAEWRYSSLSEAFHSTYDLFKVKPKTWEDREAAKQNALVLNQQFNSSINKVKFFDEYVRAAVDEGTVIVRTGWEYDEEKYEQECPVYVYRINESLGPMHEQLEQLKQQSPSQYQTDVPEELREAHDLTMEHGAPYEPVQTGTEKQIKTRVLYNRPTAEVCDSSNVVFDPTCKGDVDRAGFAVYSFESSLSVLSKDKRYQNLDKINIEGNTVLSQPDHAPDGGQNNFNFNDKPRKKFVVYEYWGSWDINGDGTVKPVVIAWVGDVIIRMEENPFPDKKIPFIVEQYLPVRRSTYGEPDGELLEDNQKVIGAVTRGMVDIMGRSANGQTGMRKDMLDATNRRKFDNGQDYEFNQNVDPRQGVFMHTFAEIPASAQFMLQAQHFEAESMTGVKSFSSQGMSGSSLGDVAAAVRGALDASSKRELGILRRLSGGIVKLGRKFISMNSEFLSPEEVVRTTNEEFVTVKRDDLCGEFDLELSISTAEEDNNKGEQLAFLLQTTGNNMDPVLRNMILSDIARLRKMPDLAHRIETYQPQPDPMTLQKQQLEIQLLQVQIAKENAQALHYQAQAQLSGAKVGTESAKAENLKSDTDQKNLNFVEQESGVTQERAKELHGEQARSQMQLKLVEHQMDRANNQEKLNTDLVKEYVKGHFAAKVANSRR